MKIVFMFFAALCSLNFASAAEVIIVEMTSTAKIQNRLSAHGLTYTVEKFVAAKNGDALPAVTGVFDKPRGVYRKTAAFHPTFGRFVFGEKNQTVYFIPEESLEPILVATKNFWSDWRMQKNVEFYVTTKRLAVSPPTYLTKVRIGIH